MDLSLIHSNLSVFACHLYILECKRTCSLLIWLLRIRTRDCCGNCCLSYSFEFVPFRISLLDNLECKWTSIPLMLYMRIRTRHCCCNRCLSYFFEFVDCGVSSLIILGSKSISGPFIWYFLKRKRNWWSNGFLTFSIAALLLLVFKCVSSLFFFNHTHLLWEVIAAATCVYLTYTYLFILVCLLLIFECVRTPRDHWYGSDESGEGIADGIVAFLRVVVFPMSFIFSW